MAAALARATLVLAAPGDLARTVAVHGGTVVAASAFDGLTGDVALWGSVRLVAADGPVPTGVAASFGRPVRLVDRRIVPDVAGRRVNAAEVEDVLLAHPAVRAAAVTGVPDAGGNALVAVVVPRGPVDLDSVLAFCRAQLAEHQVPTRLLVSDRLPVDPAV
jgi:acyl-CoA synthetase (AMP-forming)/AMP-acid ligase II